MLVSGVEVAVVVPVFVSGVEVATIGAEGCGCTMTLNVVGVAALPATSVAVHVTVVVPIANVAPDGGVQDAVPGASKSSEVAGAL